MHIPRNNARLVSSTAHVTCNAHAAAGASIHRSGAASRGELARCYSAFAHAASPVAHCVIQVDSDVPEPVASVS